MAVKTIFEAGEWKIGRIDSLNWAIWRRTDKSGKPSYEGYFAHLENALWAVAEQDFANSGIKAGIKDVPKLFKEHCEALMKRLKKVSA